MHWTIQFLIAAAILGISLGMMFLEYSRNRAGRSFLKSESIAIPYWITYLGLLVLGTGLLISALVR